MQEQTASIGPDGREALKWLAVDGALDGPATVTCAALGDRLDASTQTASRRLQKLEDAALVEREVVGDGQRVRITDEGERALRREYEQYRRVFERDTEVSLSGAVTSGMGEGRHYISLSGYMEQFRERLGYEPFPGTLNVELDEESIRRRARMDALDPVRIDGWEDENRTYGPAFCWPATVVADGPGDGRDAVPPDPDGDDVYETAHAIAPERTHHGADQLELIAPEKLRAEFALDDGDILTVHVEAQ